MTPTAITASMTRTAITTAMAIIAASVIGDRDNGPPPAAGLWLRLRLRLTAPIISKAVMKQDCHRGNAAAGTIFGALAGGLIGGAASPWQWRRGGRRRHPGRPAGQHSVARHRLRRSALCLPRLCRWPEWRSSAAGTNGAMDNLTATSPRRVNIRRGDMVCREFTETSFRPDGRSFTRTGTACRQRDGNWRFD